MMPSMPPDEFWNRLRAAARRVLLLDYDGTLAPFRVERNQAVPYPGIREVLESLLGFSTCRVVIISGRWTKDLLPLLGLSRRPEIWGSHGLERLFPDGRYKVRQLDESVIQVLAGIDAQMAAEGLERYCERKPGGLALHWRGLPPEKIQELRERIGGLWAQQIKHADLQVHEFDGGLELRVPGQTKGGAVHTILAEEKPDAVVAYLGDDHTDEDAFAALAGKGTGILVRPEWRPTKADFWLRPPEELLTFIQRWRDCCGV